MGRKRTVWRAVGLASLISLFAYVSWQFGLFAQPHRAAPLVTPEPPTSGAVLPPIGAGSGSPGAEELGGGSGANTVEPMDPAGPEGDGEAADPGVAPPGASDRLNILLLGLDARVPGEPSRSDMMLLLSLDLVRREAALLSIPRDSRVEIPGRGPDKINHAHAFGGVDLALRTVANAFQVPIHHWVSIDMTGVVALIDRLGPVTIDVPYSLTLKDGTRVGPGPVEMDGRLALEYLRERYSDPRGDIGRSERAGAFLTEMADALIGEIGPGDIPRLYSLLREHADTDIELQDGLWQRALRISLDSVRRGTVRGRGTMIDGIYYYEVDWAETAQVLRDLGIQ